MAQVVQYGYNAGVISLQHRNDSNAQLPFLSLHFSPAFYSIRKGRKRGTIRHGGRKSGTSRKRNSGEGELWERGGRNGTVFRFRPAVSAPTHFCHLTEYSSRSLLREWLSSLVVHPLLGVFFPGRVLCVQLCFTTMCVCACV